MIIKKIIFKLGYKRICHRRLLLDGVTAKRQVSYEAVKPSLHITMLSSMNDYIE